MSQPVLCFAHYLVQGVESVSFSKPVVYEMLPIGLSGRVISVADTHSRTLFPRSGFIVDFESEEGVEQPMLLPVRVGVGYVWA